MGNLTKMELGGQREELSHSVSITGGIVNYRPKEERLTNYRPNKKRCTLHLLQEIKYPSNSADEKPLAP